jgi:hypothetical protein
VVPSSPSPSPRARAFFGRHSGTLAVDRRPLDLLTYDEEGRVAPPRYDRRDRSLSPAQDPGHDEGVAELSAMSHVPDARARFHSGETDLWLSPK